MTKEEDEYRQCQGGPYLKQFGDYILLIRREHLVAFLTRRSIGLSAAIEAGVFTYVCSNDGNMSGLEPNQTRAYPCWILIKGDLAHALSY